jgi:hypothetical protein
VAYPSHSIHRSGRAEEGTLKMTLLYGFCEPSPPQG